MAEHADWKTVKELDKQSHILMLPVVSGGWCFMGGLDCGGEVLSLGMHRRRQQDMKLIQAMMRSPQREDWDWVNRYQQGREAAQPERIVLSFP